MPAGPDVSLGSNPADNDKDFRLLKRAVDEGWEIPEEVFAGFPNELIKIAVGRMDPKDPSSPYLEGARERLRAMELMAKFYGQNKELIDGAAGTKQISLHAIIVQMEQGRVAEVIDDAWIQRQIDKLPDASTKPKGKDNADD